MSRPGISTSATQAGSSQFKESSGKFEGMRSPGTSEAKKHSEGMVARTIEDQTARLPSDIFLWSAMGVAGLSAVMHCSGDHDDSRFVGQWVAPLLILGLYNKIVKVHGSDRVHAG